MAERKWTKAEPIKSVGRKSTPVPEWALKAVTEANKGYALTTNYTGQNAATGGKGKGTPGPEELRSDLLLLRRAAAQLNLGLRKVITELAPLSWSLAVQAAPPRRTKADPATVAA